MRTMRGNYTDVSCDSPSCPLNFSVETNREAEPRDWGGLTLGFIHGKSGQAIEVRMDLCPRHMRHFVKRYGLQERLRHVTGHPVEESVREEFAP